MFYDLERVKNKLIIENQIRKIAYIEKKRVLKILKPYLNKQIVKADKTTFLKKVDDELNLNKDEKDLKLFLHPLKKGDSVKLHYLYLKAEHDLIYLNVKVVYSGGTSDKNHYTQHEEGSFYIGEINDLNLKELNEKDNINLLDEKEQFKQFVKVYLLADEYRDEYNKLDYSIKDFIDYLKL